MAQGCAMLTHDSFRHQGQIPVETVDGIGARNRYESCGTTRSSIQENNSSNLALNSGPDFRQVGSADFDGNFSRCIWRREQSFKFGKDGGRRFTKVHLPGFAQHNSLLRATDQRDRFIGQEIPAAARTGEGQAAFAGAGFTAKQHTATGPRDAACMDTRKMAVPQQQIRHAIQVVIPEEFVIANGSRNEPREGEPPVDIADGEVLAIRVEREQMALPSPYQPGWAWGVFVLTDGNPDFDGLVIKH